MIRDPDHRSAWVQDLKHFPLIPGLRFTLPRMAKEKNRKKYDYFSRGLTLLEKGLKQQKWKAFSTFSWKTLRLSS